jgi:hypothetical protein
MWRRGLFAGRERRRIMGLLPLACPPPFLFEEISDSE